MIHFALLLTVVLDRNVQTGSHLTLHLAIVLLKSTDSSGDFFNIFRYFKALDSSAWDRVFECIFLSNALADILI